MISTKTDTNTNVSGGNTCRRINLSFKDNYRDNSLFSIVKSKNDKSAFVKDCIEFYINNHDKPFIQNNDTIDDVNINNKKEKKRKIQFKSE